MTGRRLCSLCMKYSTSTRETISKRLFCTAKLTTSDIRKKRSAIFEDEFQRQKREFVKRIEKIEVRVKDEQGEYDTLIMNRFLSTPYNCTMHLGEYLMKRSMVAVVNGEPWDMHRPLVEDCNLELKHALDEDPYLPNKVCWNTGSFILGYIMETSLQDQYTVTLKSVPDIPIEKGCFGYDVDLKIPNWKPNKRELLSLSMACNKLCTEELNFEHLNVDASVALQMFEDNSYKTSHISELAESTRDNRVVVYRLGEHTDIVPGPLIGNSSQMYMLNLAAIHQIDTRSKESCTYRVQGLALPSTLQINWWAYNWLTERAAKRVNIAVCDGWVYNICDPVKKIPPKLTDEMFTDPVLAIIKGMKQGRENIS